MEFEEEFPSLKKDICHIKEPIEGNFNFRCPKCEGNHTMTFEYARKVIMKNCLDKTKVREVIDKIIPRPLCDGAALNYQLKKELGLE